MKNKPNRKKTKRPEFISQAEKRPYGSACSSSFISENFNIFAYSSVTRFARAAVRVSATSWRDLPCRCAICAISYACTCSTKACIEANSIMIAFANFSGVFFSHKEPRHRRTLARGTERAAIRQRQEKERFCFGRPLLRMTRLYADGRLRQVPISRSAGGNPIIRRCVRDGAARWKRRGGPQRHLQR